MNERKIYVIGLKFSDLKKIENITYEDMMFNNLDIINYEPNVTHKIKYKPKVIKIDNLPNVIILYDHNSDLCKLMSRLIRKKLGVGGIPLSEELEMIGEYYKKRYG